MIRDVSFPHYQPLRDTALTRNHHVEKVHTEAFGAFYGPKILSWMAEAGRMTVQPRRYHD